MYQMPQDEAPTSHHVDQRVCLVQDSVLLHLTLLCGQLTRTAQVGHVGSGHPGIGQYLVGWG